LSNRVAPQWFKDNFGKNEVHVTSTILPLVTESQADPALQ